MIHAPKHDPLLDKIATSLKQRGLHSAALTLLEAGEPLIFIGSQLLWLAQPAVTLLWPTAQVRHIAQLLEDPTAIHRLKQILAVKEARQ